MIRNIIAFFESLLIIGAVQAGIVAAGVVMLNAISSLSI